MKESIDSFTHFQGKNCKSSNYKMFPCHNVSRIIMYHVYLKKIGLRAENMNFNSGFATSELLALANHLSFLVLWDLCYKMEKENSH